LLNSWVRVLVASLALTTLAHAQGWTGISPDEAVAPTSVVEGAGIKVGEGTVLHPTVGLEAGVVSNVFYRGVDPVAAALVRVLAQIGTGSLPAQRLASPEPDSVPTQQNVGDFQYRTDLSLNYDHYPSGNNAVSNQGGLGAGFNFRGIVNPERPLSFAVAETFERLLRPVNFESGSKTNRDINLLRLQTLLTPLTTLRTLAGYTNGFYSSGPSYSAAVFGTQFGYRYTPLGHVSLLYGYYHSDSINANFYRDHKIQLSLQHGFAPIEVLAEAALMFRRYEGLVVTTGPMERSDVLGRVAAQLRYNYRRWLAFAVSYQLLVDSTNYSYLVDGINFNPSYVRHEILAGVRATY